jgi:hypothetical protein
LAKAIRYGPKEISSIAILPTVGIPSDLLEAQDSEILDGFPEIHFIV